MNQPAPSSAPNPLNSGPHSIRAFLAKLPPDFVASLELPSLQETDQAFAEMGLLASGISGNKASLAKLKRLGVKKKDLDQALRELNEEHPEITRDHYRLVGGLLELIPSLGTDLLIVLKIVERIKQLCETYAESGLPKKQLLGGLPDDLCECIEAGNECMVAICSITVLSLEVGSKAGTWGSQACLEKALRRLKDGRSILRRKLDERGSGFCRESLPFGGQIYPSAHHALFAISGKAIDSIALARTEAGRSIFLARIPELRNPERIENECRAISMAMLTMPWADFPAISAGLEVEVSQAARDPQSPSKENRSVDRGVDGPIAPTAFLWGGTRHRVPGIRFHLLDALWNRDKVPDAEIGLQLWGAEWDESNLSTTASRLNLDLSKTPWRVIRQGGYCQLTKSDD